jgi:glycosyltransferase involved in cell wall biosynthesis
VGRLEPEKNPLLMADVLARLDAGRARWRLVVCGEGPMGAPLARRLEELGMGERAELRGYVPFGPALLELYRGCHALLHVSFTEGLPQVLLEAFAAGLPVVATDVGGIREAVGDAALLVPPDDPAAAAEALAKIAADAELRARLVRAGNRYVRRRTIDVEVSRLASFLRAGGGSERGAGLD